MHLRKAEKTNTFSVLFRISAIFERKDKKPLRIVKIRKGFSFLIISVSDTFTKHLASPNQKTNPLEYAAYRRNMAPQIFPIQRIFRIETVNGYAVGAHMAGGMNKPISAYIHSHMPR